MTTDCLNDPAPRVASLQERVAEAAKSALLGIKGIREDANGDLYGIPVGGIDHRALAASLIASLGLEPSWYIPTTKCADGAYRGGHSFATEAQVRRYLTEVTPGAEVWKSWAMAPVRVSLDAQEEAGKCQVWDGETLPSKGRCSQALSDRTEASTGALALSPEGDVGAIRKLHPSQGFGYWSYTDNAYPDGAPIADNWRIVWTP